MPNVSLIAGVALARIVPFRASDVSSSLEAVRIK